MDTELMKMQTQADKISCVQLRRLPKRKPQPPEQCNDDGLLLLGLALILAADGSDSLLAAMLLYILAN